MSRSSLVASLVAGLLAVTGLAAAPAPATVAIPVNCSSGPVELEWDDTHYDLEGNCGLVRVTASNATVSMPTAVRLVVRGRGNTVVSKPIDAMIVRGRGHDLRPVSVRALHLASPRSVVAVEGLVESARVRRSRSTLTARQVSELRVPGASHTVRARRGFDADLSGARNDVVFRRLDALVVQGDDNRVRVRRAATSVRNSGTGNRIRVNRRG